MNEEDKELSLTDQVKNLFFYKDDKKTLDPRKIAGILGLGVGASGILEPPDTTVGYQGGIPTYTAVRSPVTNFDYGRRPGSGGRRYFSDITYVPEGGDVGEAITAADAQANQLGIMNMMNPYSAPPLMAFAEISDYKKKPDITPEEDYKEDDMGPYMLDKNKPIPGYSGLLGLKGLADGGLAGYKKDGFIGFVSDAYEGAKDYITSGLESLGNMFTADSGPNKGKNFFGATEYTYPGGITLSTPQDKPDNIQDFFGYKQKYGEGDLAKSAGYVDILDPSTYGNASSEEAAAQRAAFNKLTFDDQQRIMGTYQKDPFSSGDDEERRSKEYSAYKRAAGGRGAKHARAESFMGGSQYEDTKARAAAGADIDMDVYNQQLQGKIVNGITVVGYTDTSGNFVPLTKNDADRALAEGIVNIEGSDKTEGPEPTSKEITSTVSSSPFTATVDTFIQQVQSGANIQAQIAAHEDALSDNPTEGNPYANKNFNTNMLRQRLMILQQLAQYKPDELTKNRNNIITTLNEMAGLSGQSGIKEGGKIKGYAVGGMPDSGLLKSSEDGMGDTIPAQVQGQPINLAGGEYIMDAEIVSMLGNGNTDAGAKVLDEFRETVRRAKHGGEDQGDQINPENFMSRLAQTGVA